VAPPELGDDPSMAEVVRAAVARSVARILSHEPGLRIGDDPEDIHQARVDTRRLRSDLRTFEAVVVEEWASPLRDELRWLGGLFGEVRDADVLLERLHRQSADLPSADHPGVRSLLRRLSKERAQARKRLLDAMTEPRYVQLLERLVRAANEPQLRPEAAAPACDELPKLVARPWKALDKAVAALPEDPPDADLHKVRIKAKRARYAAEAAAPVIGAPAVALGKALSALQDVLGEHQDAVVAEGWLREAAGRAGPDRALVAGELIGAQRAEAAACRAGWREVWEKADKKKLRAWLS
ncbi:MAG: CHAD domain-containing protein, partial [Actinomycetota bacterium]|nr:CHAD domain-containing protein [Actinomycetota bacterium]